MDELKLPKEVYFVISTLAPGEKRRYYSPPMVRIYRNKNGIKAFVDANPGREFRIFRSKTDWVEVKPWWTQKSTESTPSS